MTTLLPTDVAFAVLPTAVGLNRFANGVLQTRRDGSPIRAARAYRITDPATLADRLASRGYTDFRLVPLFRRRNSATAGRRFALTCRYPVDNARPVPEGHGAAVSFLIDHTGRQSFRAVPFLIRVACENQFTAADVRCHHTSPFLDAWLAEPWIPAELARVNLDGAGARLQDARDRTGVHIVNWIGSHRSRLARRFNETLELYRPEGNDSLWAVLQALTHSRRPGLQILANKIMTVDWHTASNREIPTTWN